MQQEEIEKRIKKIEEVKFTVPELTERILEFMDKIREEEASLIEKVDKDISSSSKEEDFYVPDIDF